MSSERWHGAIQDSALHSPNREREDPMDGPRRRGEVNRAASDPWLMNLVTVITR